MVVREPFEAEREQVFLVFSVTLLLTYEQHPSPLKASVVVPKGTVLSIIQRLGSVYLSTPCVIYSPEASRLNVHNPDVSSCISTQDLRVPNAFTTS